MALARRAQPNMWAAVAAPPRRRVRGAGRREGHGDEGDPGVLHEERDRTSPRRLRRGGPTPARGPCPGALVLDDPKVRPSAGDPYRLVVPHGGRQEPRGRSDVRVGLRRGVRGRPERPRGDDPPRSLRRGGHVRGDGRRRGGLLPLPRAQPRSARRAPTFPRALDPLARPGAALRRGPGRRDGPQPALRVCASPARRRGRPGDLVPQRLRAQTGRLRRDSGLRLLGAHGRPRRQRRGRATRGRGAKAPPLAGCRPGRGVARRQPVRLPRPDATDLPRPVSPSRGRLPRPGGRELAEGSRPPPSRPPAASSARCPPPAWASFTSS